MKPLIYVVDDDEGVRDSLQLVLEIRGYGVDSFRSGMELMERADFIRCRCMILDVHLPGESGIEILTRLRYQNIAVPVIVTSGKASHEIRSRAKALDVVAFFDKPIDGRRLLAAIGNVVQPSAGGPSP